MDNTQDTGKFDWEDIAAGGYSGLNSALFGIPDVIVNVANKDAYKALQDLRSRNKIASTVGDVAGMFAPTGGLLAKGIGSAAKLGAGALKGLNIAKGANVIGNIAKGADTVSDIIKTGGQLKGIGGAAIRGGLTAAEQALPRVLGGQQDLGQAAENIAMGGALGGGFKAAGEGLKRVPEILKGISKWGNKTMLARAGIDSKVLRQQAKYLGYSGEKAEEFVKNAAKEIEAGQLYREPKMEAFNKGIQDEWKAMAGGFDKAKPKMADLKDAIIGQSEVQNVLARNGEAGAGIVDDLISKVDKTKNFADKREFLSKLIYSDKIDDETKAVASAIKGTLENTAEELSGLDITKMKKEYPLKKVLEMADFRDELSTKGAGLARGSDTMAKLAIGGITGGAMGAPAVAGIIDDPTNQDAWGRLLTATLGGTLTGLASKQIGNGLAKVAMRLDPDDLQKLITKVAGEKTVEGIQKIVTQASSPKLSDFMGKIEKPTTALEKMAGATPSQVVEKIITSEETASPETVETAKADVNEKYMGVLKSTLQKDYQQYFADQMSYEDFEKQVSDLTDNFNPVKTAGVIFKDPGQRDKYLKDYNIALKLKNVDVGTIGNAPNLFEAVTNPQSVAEQKKAYSDMIDTISTLVTNEGDLPSKAVKDQIAADVKVIADLPATKEEKQKLLMDKLGEKYGLDLQTLTALGVV